MFPNDIIDWLFGLGGQAAAGVGNWFSSIGGGIASGIEGGFIAVLKDWWDTIRPVIYIGLGALIMIVAGLWFVTGSETFRSALAAGAMLIK